jgi:polar amino acid transport system substrate-binding protein
MKKYLALTLVLVLCLALLAGCGTKASGGKTYTIGTDTTFAPFEFEDDNGKHTGIDIKLMEAIAEEMGFKVEWQVLGFNAAVTALEAGQVDGVIAGMSIRPDRELKYDFSEPYYNSTTGVAVKADSTAASLEDLRGQTVVVKTGTTGADYAESIAEEYALEPIYVEESSVMYTYVESGQAAACFEDYPVIQYEIARGNVKCKVINQSEDSTPYGFAVMKGTHTELLTAFNEGLKRMKDSGKYDEILNTYFGEK